VGLCLYKPTQGLLLLLCDRVDEMKQWVYDLVGHGGSNLLKALKHVYNIKGVENVCLVLGSLYVDNCIYCCLEFNLVFGSLYVNNCLEFNLVLGSLYVDNCLEFNLVLGSLYVDSCLEFNLVLGSLYVDNCLEFNLVLGSL